MRVQTKTLYIVTSTLMYVSPYLYTHASILQNHTFYLNLSPTRIDYSIYEITMKMLHLNSFDSRRQDRSLVQFTNRSTHLDHESVLTSIWEQMHTARQHAMNADSQHLFANNCSLAQHPCSFFNCGTSGRPSLEGLPTLVTHTLNSLIMLLSALDAINTDSEEDHLALFRCPGTPRSSHHKFYYISPYNACQYSDR